MEHQEGFFQGAENANIYYQSWTPKGKPKAILLLVHGLSEHSGRYMNLVRHFIPLGYAIYAFDHVGHGKSGGMRCFVRQFENFTDTIKIYFDTIRAQHPEEQIFLIGHSMGGMISTAYLLEFQDELSGAIISGAAAEIPDEISSFSLFLGKIFSTLLPKLRLIGMDLEGICRDPVVVQDYIEDPLVYKGKLTARMANELLKGINLILAKFSTIHLPIFFVHGGADKIVNPRGAQMLYDNVSSEDKTIKIYEGLYHEVFNEPEYPIVLKDVENWLEAHLSVQEEVV